MAFPTLKYVRISTRRLAQTKKILVLKTSSGVFWVRAATNQWRHRDLAEVITTQFCLSILLLLLMILLLVLLLLCGKFWAETSPLGLPELLFLASHQILMQVQVQQT